MLSLMIPAMLAAAAASTPAPADLAEVRCVAVLSTLAGDGIPDVQLTEEQKGGLAALVMYYVGKLDRIDIEGALLKELAPQDAIDRLVREDLPRCGKETEMQGAMLTELGKRLEAVGK